MTYDVSVVPAHTLREKLRRVSFTGVWPPSLIFLLVFVMESLLAHHWASMGLFAQYNVVFDADPNLGTLALAHGWMDFNFNHPLMNYMTAIPLRVLAKVLAIAGPIENEAAWREAALLYLLAALAAAKSLFFYFSFRVLRLSIWQASAATMIGSLSFSSVVFGAVPDSYALSGATMALGMWLALLMATGQARWVRRAWWLTAMCSIGITVSNVIQFGWLNVCRLVSRGDRPMRAFLGSIGSGALLLAIVCGLGYALALASGTSKQAEKETAVEWQVNFINKHLVKPKDVMENLARFPERVARTFVPTMPFFKQNRLAAITGRIPAMSTYNGLAFDVAAGLLWLGGLIGCGLGAFIAYRLGGLWRWFGLGSLASILSYGIVFSLFGGNSYLYSQYWHVPAVLLVGACLSLRWTSTWPGKILLGLVISGLAAGNLITLSEISRVATQLYD